MNLSMVKLLTSKESDMNRISSLSLALMFLVFAAQLTAQDTPWYEAIGVNGYVSSSYTYNLNTPQSMENGLRIFDQKHNSFAFDVFQLAIGKSAEAAGDAGFRFDLITGALPQYTASSGLFGGQNIDVLQGYVTYVVPVGSGLKLDAGKFLTHMGYELIEGVDGWNDNVSRSYLFGFAIPFAHTGVRASYNFCERICGMVMVANGWDNAVENNTNKTVGGQLALTPTDDLCFAVNGIYGAEGDNDNSNNTTVIDLVGTYALNDMFTVGVNADFGSADAAAAEGEDGAWSGFAGYLRINLGEKFSLSLRGEQFDDTDGLRTGMVQKLTEFTITPEYRPTGNLVIRGDFRMDSSDESVFEDGDSFFNPAVDNIDSQSTISLNMLITF
ncbi:MAG: hypothetical protein C0600_16665 [Ignavibacteria bacterium]|nr:MAG: hypothetical protein C0600_16665 [Ignavibacteria bacterium]